MLHFYKHLQQTVVWKSFKGKENVTLGQTFEMLGLGANSLNLDSLSVQAGEETYMRFDAWLDKYNPFGKAELRDLFLKHENDVGGRFFAELIGSTALRSTDINPSLKIELRISVCGRYAGNLSDSLRCSLDFVRSRSRNELDIISRWIKEHRLTAPGNRWLLQVPRVYAKLRSDIRNFGDILDSTS